MNLNDAFLRVTTETKEQFDAALSCAASAVVLIDSGFFLPEEWNGLCENAHAAGKLCGIRLPRIWRTRAERFFTENRERLLSAGFDTVLVGCMEGLGFLQESDSTFPLILDHSIYAESRLAEELILEMAAAGQTEERPKMPETTGFGGIAGYNAADFTQTFPLELSAHELERLGTSFSGTDRRTELVVYGRTMMMVSAQCIRKTTLGCDRRPVTMQLKDRTGALLPVKNCCRFCENYIYNTVPTVLFDQAEALSRIPHTFERLEFTTETASEVRTVLQLFEKSSGRCIHKDAQIHGKRPRVQELLPGFTRGYFKRGVE